MPRVSEETIGAGDQSWIGGTHGIYNCRSGVIDPSSFDPADYPDGYLPSGTRVALVDERFVKFAAGASDGTEVLAGMVYTDQKVSGTELINAPIFNHGQIRIGHPALGGFDPTGVETTALFTYITAGGGS